MLAAGEFWPDMDQPEADGDQPEALVQRLADHHGIVITWGLDAISGHVTVRRNGLSEADDALASAIEHISRRHPHICRMLAVRDYVAYDLLTCVIPGNHGYAPVGGRNEDEWIGHVADIVDGVMCDAEEQHRNVLKGALLALFRAGGGAR